MGADGYSDGSDDNNRDMDNENSVEVSTIHINRTTVDSYHLDFCLVILTDRSLPYYTLQMYI